ncbi:chitinase [Epithele typhae]|uniref:chitinase n=1 Tax=Epithele typhae TaxID=378194 RepID=UPI002008530F|nr:chitinase [Epithele typhae]KAH9932818.1 chitinase [Epithele typhae]
MFSFSHLITSVSAALALASVSSVLAAPLPEVTLSRRAVSVPSPAFVVYTDKFIDANVLPAATDVQGFNVVNLSFLTLKGAFDQALAFANLPADQKAAKKAEYAAAGINIMVSAFGETDKPTTSGADPVDTANTMAQFVLDQGLDGIDVDYEDLDAMNKGDGAAETWVTTFTQTLRGKLPVGQFILSHAPLAPWLAPNAQFGGGAYVTINKNVGDQIDFYNIQFYNQGLYADCDGLINTAGAPFNGSALLEIPANGFDINKLVIGKPGAESDATNGFIDPATLGTCVAQAKAAGWNAGVMAFQFPGADAAWVSAAKGAAFE